MKNHIVGIAILLSTSSIVSAHNLSNIVRDIRENTPVQKIEEKQTLQKQEIQGEIELIVEGPRKEQIEKISEQNKKRNRRFSLIRTGAIVGAMGFVAFKLFKMKNKTHALPNQSEQIAELTQRIEVLEKLTQQSTFIRPQQSHWLIENAKDLGYHAGGLIVDGLVGALVVDAITGSITNAVTNHIPLNELLAKKHSFNWLLEQKTHYQSNLSRCSSLLNNFNAQPEEQDFIRHYLWYHTQELVFDIEQIVGFLACEEEEAKLNRQKATYKLLQSMLIDTANNLCQQINKILTNQAIAQLTTEQIDAIKNELESINGLVDEIRIRTKKQNSLFPRHF